jgi:ketosteroid isomerase-like protein
MPAERIFSRVSEEDVEIVRRVFEAVNSEDIELTLALTHPDFEVEVPPELSAEPDVYRGVEGMRRYWQSFREAMDEIRFRAEQLWDAGDSVVVAMIVTAKGRQTAIAVEQRPVTVWRMRDGKVVRITIFTSLAEGLASAGLAG